jgi:plastocyanin
MLEQLWSQLIAFTEPYVVPDWGSLVNLLPIFLALLILLVLGWVFYRLLTAGPTRRGKQRLTPVPPKGTHLPGPSFAPILGAFGVFMTVFGLVTGGLWVWVGLITLAVTLLYWGREALRDYDRIPGIAATTAGALPAPAGAPPTGVHIPAPSFRPLLVAMSMTLLVAGLIVGGWAILFGAVALALTLLGWLRDSRREYVAVEDADRTGHLDAGPAPAWPKTTFAVLAVLLAAGVVLTSGVLPNSGGAPAASGGPAAGGGAGGGTGGGATATPALPPADVSLTAENISFVETQLQAPAGKAFTLAFDNKDSVPHNVAIKDASGTVKFKGEIVTGPKAVVYDVPALAPGTYGFLCDVHPSMTGTLDVK